MTTYAAFMHNPERKKQWEQLHREKEKYLAGFDKALAKIRCLREGCDEPREKYPKGKASGPYCVACRKRGNRMKAELEAARAKRGEAHHVATGDVPAPRARYRFPVLEESQSLPDPGDDVLSARLAAKAKRRTQR